MTFSKVPRGLEAHDGDTLTHAEFKATMADRFGEDPLNWAFRCPACGDIATGTDMQTALEQHPRKRNGEPLTWNQLVGQECIGRTLGPDAVRGCDYAAYGLIPLAGLLRVVVAHDVATHIFPIAEGAPA